MEITNTIKSAYDDFEVALAEEDSKYKAGKESSFIGEILCLVKLPTTESFIVVGPSFFNPTSFSILSQVWDSTPDVLY